MSTRPRLVDGRAHPARATALTIEAGLLATIVAHLRRALPNEGVGLLSGVIEGGRRRAVRFYPGTNVDASPARYTMAPEEVVAALADMTAQHLDLVAIAHSHPSTAPTLSATDLREAYYPGVLLVIVGFAADPVEFRAWDLGDEHEAKAVRPVPIEASPRGGTRAAGRKGGSGE